MNKYITIVDPKGATVGYDGPFIAVSHSVLFEPPSFYGFESVQKFFTSHQAMVDFLAYCATQEIGATGTFNNALHTLNWAISDKPIRHRYGSVEVLTKS